MSAQDGYFTDWFQRVDKTRDRVTALGYTAIATTTPRLEQEFRYDQVWQVNSEGVTTDNYDGGKAWS
jgi:hypothetical protein